ncbi:uncharacterized protein LOC107779128 isoform X5 [Nicotiana tabacum]
MVRTTLRPNHMIINLLNCIVLLALKFKRMKNQAKNDIEPTRAEIFILTHKKRKDGRLLDEESAKAVDMMNERLGDTDGSNDQPLRSVAWEGDVYSQVLRNNKS